MEKKLYDLLFDVAISGAVDSEVLKAAELRDRETFNKLFSKKIEGAIWEILKGDDKS